MMGKGSINHNNRSFTAKNVDSDRSKFNVTYCEENIKTVYHELFDPALERYNIKQKRSDRMITDYYEKIRTGKQEKLYHEVIFQIGNKDDMNSQSSNGLLAMEILDEFAKRFPLRNPNLRVFSSHLHMDEETPHLHIDFVPFINDSTRGLDTRVSLKGALAALGFKGGTRGATEWNQWMENEKHELAHIMEQYDIRWKQLGTHNKHLSILEYEKQERGKEIQQLDQLVDEKNDVISEFDRKIMRLESENIQLQGAKDDLQKRQNELKQENIDFIIEQVKYEERKELLETEIEDLKEVSQMLAEENNNLALEKHDLLITKESLEEKAELLNNEILKIQDTQKLILQNVRRYDYPEWNLPEPGGFMSAKAYYESKAFPLVARLKATIKKMAAQVTVLEEKIRSLNQTVKWYKDKVGKLVEELFEKDKMIESLQEKADDLARLKRYIGEEQTNNLLEHESQLDRHKRNNEPQGKGVR
jgi:hypothetical protein